MPDTEKDQTSSDTTLSTADAFSLVGHEIRAEIMSLYGNEDEDERVIPFGGIRSRMTIDVEPSQLHYHLDQLVGHYIDRTENGYHLRPEGIRLLLTVKRGAFGREQETMWLDPDFDCHTCQEPVKAILGENNVTIWCAECDIVYACDFLTMPIGAFSDGPEMFSFAHYSKYIIQKSMSIASGVCPNCAHPLQTEFRSRKEHPYDRKVVIDHSCALCKANWMVWAGQALLADSGLRSFCADHGIDLLSTPYWELEFAATDEHVTIRSTDPWKVAIEVTFDDETLELVVDEDLNVLERNRSTTHDLGSMAPQDGEQNEDGSTGKRQQGDGIVLPDKTTCLQSLRRHRWPDGVTCTHCGSEDTIKQGKSKKDAQRYRCQTCESSFNDLTGTVFAKRGLSVPEMCYIIGEMDETDTARIARELDRSYNSVLQFVHQVKDARTDENVFDLSEVFGDNGVV